MRFEQDKGIVKVFDPDPKLRWLFSLTHPDDEVAVIVWIRMLVEAGADVFVTFTHANEVREAEGKAALATAGVGEDRLFFLHGSDQGIVDEIGVLMPKIAEIAAEVRPDRVACPAFEQGHIDHDATNFMTNRVFEGTPVLEFPLYHPYTRIIQRLNRFADSTGEEVLEVPPEMIPFKIGYARLFPSQNLWRILFWHHVIMSMLFRPPRLYRTERMRFQTHRDFLAPNLPPKLAEEVRRGAIWKRWETAIRPWIG